jgi:hypothetical protein
MWMLACGSGMCLRLQLCLVTWCVRTTNTLIHNILWTAPQLSISQRALGTLPEDGNVMPKDIGDTIDN